ncbi:PepSY domain-containing protein [Streptomyces sp. NPDC015131]|uniref:PepSY domain-containing protein n=1 Tax=Streptomyces sp. NPDC015131 TaxID=3364941 RepID=UPI0036F71DD5
MKRKRTTLAVAAVATAALLTGGTAAAFASSASGSEAPVKAPKVTAEQALKAVEGHGTVVSLDLDDDAPEGKQSWEVELVKDGTTQEWTVDGTTAKAAQEKPDADDADDASDKDD